MSKITFRNILDESSEFKETNMEYLIPAVYEYARTCGNDELYSTIMKNKIVIYVNNECVAPEDWNIYRLKEGSEVIISPEIEGGDSGGFLQILIGVGLIALSYFNPFTWGATTQYWVGMMGAAIALGGLSQILFQPDLPSLDFRSSGKSQTYSWSGIRTVAQEDISIPIVYGTHKVGGNLISLFTERISGEDYLYMLIALAEGEIDGICKQDNYASVCITSQPTSSYYRTPAIELDDQPISDYTNVSWWYRKGVNATAMSAGDGRIQYKDYDPTIQRAIPGFDSAKTQIDDGRSITAAGVTYTTTKEVDMVTAQIYATALYDASNPEVGLTSRSVTYRVKFRKEGTSVWYDYYPFYWTPYVLAGVTMGGTEIPSASSHVSVSFSDPSFKYAPSSPDMWWLTISSVSEKGGILNAFVGILGTVIVFDGFKFNDSDGEATSKEYKINVECSNRTTKEVIFKECIYRIERQLLYYQQVWDQPNEWAVPTEIPIWGPTVHTYPSINVGQYTATFKEFIMAGNKYSLTSSSGYATSLDITMTGKTKTGLWHSVTIDFINHLNGSGKNVYEVNVYRLHGDKSTSMQIEDDILLHSVVEIVQGKFIYPNTALLGLKIKATDQLSGSPPNITTIIRGKKVKVPDLEDSTPSGSDVAFDACFWDTVGSKWEQANGATTYWNNTSSWRDEFSNNAMLCVRDLLISKRYGLGEYLNEEDLHTSGVNNIIKQCHTSYEPTEEDHVKWWDGNNADTFDSSIHLGVGGYPTVSIQISNSARTITFSGSYMYYFYIDLGSPLHVGQTYTISITLSTLTANVSFRTNIFDGTSWGAIGSEVSNISAGVHSFSFTPTKTGYSKLAFNIFTYVPPTYTDVIPDVGLIVTDISVNRSGDEKMRYHTWDGVLDNAQSALSALLEMCDSFRVWPVWYEGKFNFIMNKDETPVQTLSRGNTTELTQNFSSLTEIPYKLIGQYTDEDRRWELKSLMAKATDTTLTKINEKTIGLKGVTNRKKAEREIKFKLNQITNCTHFINIKAGLDSVHFTAGDLFYLQDDLPQWGQGGRIIDYSATNLNTGLIGYWKFDEGAGTTVNDYSGNGFTCTLYNTEDSDFVDGVSGGALYFNEGSANEYGNILDNATLDGVLSFCVWVNPVAEVSHTTAYHIILTKHLDYRTGLSITYTNSPNIIYAYFQSSTNSVSYASYQLPAYNTWYHLAAVFENNITKLYVNGNLTSYGGYIGNADGYLTYKSGQPVRLAGGVTNRYSSIKTTLARLYNRPLTAKEVKDLYNYPPIGVRITPEDSIVINDASATNIVRYQTSDNSYVTATVNTATSVDGVTRRHLKLLNYPQNKLPKSDAVFAFGKSGSSSKKFRAVSVVRTKDDEVDINAVEHLSELYTTDPVISVVEDRISELPPPLGKPDPPKNPSVSTTTLQDGVGFVLSAEFPNNQSGIKEIVVQMKKYTESDDVYDVIAVIPPDRKSVTYINNSLVLDIKYTFKFTCRTQFKSSDPVTLSKDLISTNYLLPPPNGIKIKGKDQNSSIFDGKDVTIEWSPIGTYSGLFSGIYKVEVWYSSSERLTSRLRESYVSGTTFTYSFENMMEDTGGAIYGTSTYPLVFLLFSLNTAGYAGISSSRFVAYNLIPKNITGASSVSSVGGVSFSWGRSTETDHKSYQYCTKVGSGDWNTATKISDNKYTRRLTTSDISNYGTKSTIYIRVKDVDWHKQVSATYALTSASANLLSDNLFQLFSAKSSGVVGTTSDLYDGNLSSGGVVVT